MAIDLDLILAHAETAAEAVGEEWAWDDGTLIDLCRHESPIGITCTWASGSPAAPHIAGMDPKTTLALVAELRAARTFHDDIRAALRPGRWRGFNGPDGVSKDEIIADVAGALQAHDKAVGEVS